MSTLFARPDGDDDLGNDKARRAFSSLKAICVPLLGLSIVTPSNTARTIELLGNLIIVLKNISDSPSILTPALIQYTFFPLSSLLRRNDIKTIPDQVLERIFLSLEQLCIPWWWTYDAQVWEQIVLLTGSVLAPSNRGEKDRDDHTREAACMCLWQLLRPRSPEEEAALGPTASQDAQHRSDMFRDYAVTPKFFPTLGQLVNNLLLSAFSPHMPLQLISLRLIRLVIAEYLGPTYAPTILPGVVSSMCKILMGRQSGARGWQNGEVIEAASSVLDVIIVNSICDDVCIADRAVRGPVSGIEELVDLGDPQGPSAASPSPTTPEPQSGSPFAFHRTSSWLNATASQLHIAINTLTPLVNHPTTKALLAFSELCSNVLARTLLTMTPTHRLLLSNLLTLSISPHPVVSLRTRSALIALLNPQLLQILIDMTQVNMVSLPLLVPTHSDTKVQHLARQVEAVCLISREKAMHPIAIGLASLLGPTGGIEKWGYNLLNVLDFTTPAIVPLSTQQLLEAGSAEYSVTGSQNLNFPALELRQLSSRETYTALEKMFRALGRVGGEKCLFAVEWFVERGMQGGTRTEVAALWSACRLLEGVGDIELGAETSNALEQRGKRLEKACRWIVKTMAETLDEQRDDDPGEVKISDTDLMDSDTVVVDYKKGVTQLTTILDLGKGSSSSSSTPRLRESRKNLHSTLCLHLIAVSTSLLAQKSRPLLMHALYPLIQCLVSPDPLVVSTAQATLHVVTNAAAYASPSNLVLANFDYALNSVSLHLTRSRFDIRATKVLVILVRLVGRAVVERAGDVVEECFDRLDEYHGYGVVVEGLVQVLAEVVNVVKPDDDDTEAGPNAKDSRAARLRANDAFSRGDARFAGLLQWFDHRHDHDPLGEEEDFGPVPQHAWGQPTDAGDEGADADALPPAEDAPPPSTPLQALTQQIVSRSIYFLPHSSSFIRSRILSLLAASVPILKTVQSTLLPAIHKAWPFIVNRLSDSEPFVVTEAAALVEALAVHVGDFMTRRIWEDVWPRFRKILQQLEDADLKSALARRGRLNPGMATTTPLTAYSTSHRLYRSMVSTVTGIVRGIDLTDALAWEITIAFRRFLNSSPMVHGELQAVARELYVALGRHNPDMVWLVLCGTAGTDPLWSSSAAWDKEDDIGHLAFPRHLFQERWDIIDNARIVLNVLSTP
ncbi:hypothetical protein BS47DRAFT_743415 [Hydnum rufescens UP504]|uniref:Uncharacterized protein n=1 Tax=Hydnum rufescens UP504 TaxID=1448309 RepID=A0A9P6B1G1_9AGAM|nr:hypothetical protein BS47DRAFT_743415 [Hydnum rufescens UP504]